MFVLLFQIYEDIGRNEKKHRNPTENERESTLALSSEDTHIV